MAAQEDGSYAGFNEQELTSQSGGKARAARLIKVPYTQQAVTSKTLPGSSLSTMPPNSNGSLMQCPMHHHVCPP